MLQCHNIRVRVFDQLPHDLQLAILEALVLQDFLDGHDFPRFDNFGFKDDTKGAVPNDTFRRIRYILLR